jgi:hypothetical protein
VVVGASVATQQLKPYTSTSTSITRQIRPFFYFSGCIVYQSGKSAYHIREHSRKFKQLFDASSFELKLSQLLFKVLWSLLTTGDGPCRAQLRMIELGHTNQIKSYKLPA